jgi:Protein of unknown function (DUF2852)
MFVWELKDLGIATDRQEIGNIPRGEPMTTIQAIVFGMMLVWTPTLVLVAYLFWAKRIGVDDDQEWRERTDPPSSSCNPLT